MQSFAKRPSSVRLSPDTHLGLPARSSRRSVHWTDLRAFNAIQNKEAGTGFMVVGVILGVLELIMAVYSIAHPAVLVVSLGLLAALYFIENGANMIFIGSAYAKATALARRAV